MRGCIVAVALVAALALGRASAALAIPAGAIAVPQTGGDPWTPDGVARLSGDLDALLANGAALASAHVGVLAVDTASGRVLYAKRADEEFQPASTLKLLVGSAALDR
ncbi:MAG: D-alanyl-D-alanine carboxypeptidase, partial [Candidatus Eremiobacteraeota bacterium]|nr:D-alanyl-D-alanine carboxypeptidase [Candidatus Eremiobacteraeota bacterium]